MNPERSRRVEAIVETILRIPRGRVASYGQVARVAGLPGLARFVGRVLRDSHEDSGLPWHRVLGASGRISFPPESNAARLQRDLLETEGVAFRAGRVDWSRCRWREGLDDA